MNIQEREISKEVKFTYKGADYIYRKSVVNNLLVETLYNFKRDKIFVVAKEGPVLGLCTDEGKEVFEAYRNAVIAKTDIEVVSQYRNVIVKAGSLVGFPHEKEIPGRFHCFSIIRHGDMQAAVALVEVEFEGSGLIVKLGSDAFKFTTYYDKEFARLIDEIMIPEPPTPPAMRDINEFP